MAGRLALKKGTNEEGGVRERKRLFADADDKQAEPKPRFQHFRAMWKRARKPANLTSVPCHYSTHCPKERSPFKRWPPRHAAPSWCDYITRLNPSIQSLQCVGERERGTFSTIETPSGGKCCLRPSASALRTTAPFALVGSFRPLFPLT